MKQYSFSFEASILEQFKKCLPPHRSKKILKNYLLNEYELPVELKELEKAPDSPAVQPYWMAEDEIRRIDHLIDQAKKKEVTLNRSSIMRDIMKNLVQKYQDSPIEKSKQHRQTFKLPTGTKQRLSQLITDGELTYELSSYIMEAYTPSNDFASMRGQTQEDLTFKSDVAVFEKMDDIAEQYGFKKGGRAKIFRDALTQFENSLQSNPPKKAALQKELKYLIDEYKAIEETDKIQEEIQKYLKDK